MGEIKEATISFQSWNLEWKCVMVSTLGYSSFICMFLNILLFLDFPSVLSVEIQEFRILIDKDAWKEKVRVKNIDDPGQIWEMCKHDNEYKGKISS